MTRKINTNQSFKLKMPNEVINSEQINHGRDLIAKKHPLMETPIEKALPFLKPFYMCKKKKKSFKLGLRYALMHKMGMDVPKSEKQMDENPFLLLGYGVNAYLSQMTQLMCLFIVLGIFSAPMFYIYSSGSSLEGKPNYALMKYSLGNLGIAQSICKNTLLDEPEFALTCTDGTIQQLIDYGIQPKHAGFQDYCLNSMFPDHQECNEKYLERTKFLSDFNALCQGKKTCYFPNALDYIDSSAPESCKGEESKFFAQAGCKFTPEEQKTRQMYGLIISCTGVFIAFIFIITVDYMQAYSAIEVTQWDVSTVTAQDYTAELEIPNKLYDNFVSQVYPNLDTTESKGEAFKNFLVREIEEKVASLPNQGFETDEVHCKIALCTLVFKNAALIKKLQARGALIKNLKHEAVRKADMEIDQFRKDHAEELNRPVAAFITWESEEGIERCKRLQELAMSMPDAELTSTLLGCELQFEEASHPSDIIWENRELSDEIKRNRTFKAVAIVSFMLLVCFLIVLGLKKATGLFTLKYPGRVNCEALIEANHNKMKKYAIQDWFEYQRSNGYQYKGYTQCFCAEQKKTLGNDVATTKFFDENARDFDEQPIEPAQICKQWNSDMWFGAVLAKTITFTLVVLNHYLKIYVAQYISGIGDKTHSTRLKKITLGTFMAMFFNLALILLLVNSDFRDSGLPLSNVFNSGYNDFTTLWYQKVGYAIIDAMVYNSFFPFVIFAFQMSKVFYARMLDRGLSLDPYSTKKTTVMQYVELYSGPEYAIHAKYSINLLVAYVCMMYGFGIPILFFVATLTYAVLWTIERIMVCYVCTLPPNFDQSLNKNSLSILRWAVLFYLAFGYWMVDAPRIFDNEILPRDTPSSSQHTKHVPFHSMTKNHAVPMLVGFMIAVVIVCGRAFFKKYLKQWGYKFEKPQLNVDENNPSYWNSLKYSDQLWLIKENEQMERLYFFNLISPRAEELIKHGGHSKKKIQGVPFYFILANPRYANSMSFVPVCTPNRIELIIDEEDDEFDNEQSDMVTILFNMAYLPDAQAKFFSFKPEFTKDFQDNKEQFQKDLDLRKHQAHGYYEQMALKVTGYNPPTLDKKISPSALTKAMMNK